MAHHVVQVAAVLEARGVGTLDGEVTDSPLTQKSDCKTYCSLLAVLAHPQEGDHVDQPALGPYSMLLYGCYQGRLGVGALHAAVVH